VISVVWSGHEGLRLYPASHLSQLLVRITLSENSIIFRA
jgi:hypothetical protein